MRIFFERILTAIVFCLCMSAGAYAQQGVMRVVVFGDSLTSGYQLPEEDSFSHKLNRKLQEVGYTNVEVLNMSADGESSTEAAERLNTVLVKRPDIVIVELGSNDAIRGINTDLVYTNLVNIIGKLLQQRVYVILVGVKTPASKDVTYSRQFYAVYERLADFYRLPFYPNALEGIWGNPDLNLADGYHPNGKGVDVMVEGMYRLVDTGLRWKWEALSSQSQYLYDTSPKGVGAPAPVTAEPLPPALPAAQ
jgi:acyl-CoA thioesterase-1